MLNCWTFTATKKNTVSVTALGLFFFFFNQAPCVLDHFRRLYCQDKEKGLLKKASSPVMFHLSWISEDKNTKTWLSVTHMVGLGFIKTHIKKCCVMANTFHLQTFFPWRRHSAEPNLGAPHLESRLFSSNKKRRRREAGNPGPLPVPKTTLSESSCPTSSQRTRLARNMNQYKKLKRLPSTCVTFLLFFFFLAWKSSGI